MGEPKRSADLLTAAELAEIEKLYCGCTKGHAVDTCVFCWDDRALATIRALAEAINGIIAGFEAGVFVRDVSRDHEPMWALRLAPYLAALAKAEVLARRVLGTEEDRRFLGLALAGEVGELLNLLKKEWRGDEDDGSWEGRVIEEMADCRIYLEMLARAFAVNLDTACAEVVRTKLRARWPFLADQIDQALTTTPPVLLALLDEIARLEEAVNTACNVLADCLAGDWLPEGKQELCRQFLLDTDQRGRGGTG